MRERWDKLIGRVAGSERPVAAVANAAGVWEDLVQRYTGPDRKYHDLRHIEACLARFDSARNLFERPDAVELAIWFHDAVYDSKRSDNEAQSARLAAESLSPLDVSAALLEGVGNLILATRHQATAMDNDTTLLVDIDLSILGQSQAVFDEYEAGIRFEYAWVSEADFRAGRSKVLRSFLDRTRIYLSEPFFAELESKARANLARSLAALGG